MSALAKYMFHSPEVMALLKKRIDALRAVREVRKRDEFPFNMGATAEAHMTGDKVVKFPSPKSDLGKFERSAKMEDLKEIKRRGFLKSIASEKGLAPETMLVETKGNKYLVQPNLVNLQDLIKGSTSYKKKLKLFDEVPAGLSEGLNKAGISAGDAATTANIAMLGTKPVTIDLGYEQLTRAMTPGERQSALQKFISYGRRKKPWLED